MTSKLSRYETHYSQYNDWKKLCPEGTWRKVDPSTLSGSLPKDLLSKTNSILLVATGSPQSSIFMANLNRIDLHASAIDQEPFVLAFDHSTSSASGAFIHHGNWPGRTTLPGPAFFNAIETSGIQAHYPLSEMPSEGSGNLDELKVSSQSDAYWTGVSALSSRY